VREAEAFDLERLCMDDANREETAGTYQQRVMMVRNWMGSAIVED
jgi:hypothetical protein